MTALQKIVREAKAIQKAHPNKAWKDCIKQASAAYKRTTKKAPVKKKKVGDYKLNKSDFLETILPLNPRKKKEKKVKKYSVTRSSGGQFKKGGIKRISGTKTHKDTKSHNVNIRVVSGLGQLFDTSIIKDIDSLKKQYFKLAKKYHPDAGGTTSQFQQLQAEYEKLLNSLLRGSSFTTEQKNNEVELDKAMRAVVDAIINLEGINIELIGKWLWVSGNTYPVRAILKSAGLIFIKKDSVPYWVYKGVESSSRGGTTMEDIKKKYGSSKIETKQGYKKLSGIGNITASQKIKLKYALKRVVKALNKRPI